MEKPANIKPIDFENYNDVYTVYWNYRTYCDETDPNPGDSIKVWGWITNYSLPSTGTFFIYSQPQGDYRRRVIFVLLPKHVGNELAMKMVNITFPAKCFLYGEVMLPCLEEGTCRNKVTVSLYVNDVNNIYFE